MMNRESNAVAEVGTTYTVSVERFPQPPKSPDTLTRIVDTQTDLDGFVIFVTDCPTDIQLHDRIRVRFERTNRSGRSGNGRYEGKAS